MLAFPLSCIHYIAFKCDSQCTISLIRAIYFCAYCRFLLRYFYDILYLLSYIK
nr:MAG TPA: hypothetical protein [Caudoviricetes sp.]